MEDILVHFDELKKRKYKLTDSQRNRLYTVDKDVFIDVMNYQLRDKAIRAMGFSSGRPMGFEEAGTFDTVNYIRLYETEKDSAETIPDEALEMCVDFALDLLCGSNAISQMFSSNSLSQIIHLAAEHEYRKLVDVLSSKRKSVPEGKENWNMGRIIEKYDQLAKYQEQEEEEEDYEWNEDEFRNMVYQPKKQQSLSELMLVTDVEEAVQTFKLMYEKRYELKNEDLPTFNRILFGGPPGNGKTALAGAIGKELGMPIYFFDASKVRAGHIGEMGQNIWTVFRGIQRVAKNGKAILFIDECDSMATRRVYESGADKEDSAALNAILTKLDQLSDNTIVLAATNYPDELDPAFVRRFNLRLYLGPPTAEAVKRYMAGYQKKHKVIFTAKEIRNVPMDAPWSKVKEYCQGLHSKRILGTPVRIDMGWIGKKVKTRPSVGFRI